MTKYLENVIHFFHNDCNTMPKKISIGVFMEINKLITKFKGKSQNRHSNYEHKLKIATSKE